MKKRVLVAGGAGFLGSHLCAHLIEKGCHVFCLDSFVTGREENVASLLGRPNFKLIAHDVIRPIDVAVDEIYNLACPASPKHYQQDPIGTVKTSVLGALNLLALAKRSGIPIFQASTSEIYGDPDQHPQVESYRGNVNSVGPRACYDEGKRCAETLCFDYQRQYGVDVRVARIFNTFGPRMQPNDGRVVSNLIVQALQSHPLTIFGTGEQTRSFCYVSDLIAGIVRMMEVPGPLPGPINLGNPTEYTVTDLAGLIVSLTGSKSEIVLKPLPEDDPRRRCPDITKAITLLQWRPRMPLRAGLRKTIDYFRAKLSQDDRGRQTARASA